MTEKALELPAIKPPADHVIQVSIPISAAYNLEKMQKIQKELLGKLGCPACHSGWDLRFDLQREFMVDAALNLREA